MKPHIMVTILPDDGPGPCLHGGFCKGMYILCKGIEKYGSLFAITNKIGMAYSKAWKLLNECEDTFGDIIVKREGAHGSTITDFGKELMSMYESEVARCHYQSNN